MRLHRTYSGFNSQQDGTRLPSTHEHRWTHLRSIGDKVNPDFIEVFRCRRGCSNLLHVQVFVVRKTDGTVEVYKRSQIVKESMGTEVPRSD